MNTIKIHEGESEHLSTIDEHLIGNDKTVEWRRDKIQQLSSQGYTQREIANILQIGVGTVNKDIAFLRQQSRENIKKYVDEMLPEEYEKCLIGLNSILKEAWMTSQRAQSEREKIQALNLAKECYSMKMDMLTNATVIDDAIRFIAANIDSNKKDESKESVNPIESEERLTTNQIF